MRFPATNAEDVLRLTPDKFQHTHIVTVLVADTKFPVSWTRDSTKNKDERDLTMQVTTVYGYTVSRDEKI